MKGGCLSLFFFLALLSSFDYAWESWTTDEKRRWTLCSVMDNNNNIIKLWISITCSTLETQPQQATWCIGEKEARWREQPVEYLRYFASFMTLS